MKYGMRMAAAVWLCACAGMAADWKTLKPQGCVSDYADAVDPASLAELGAYCTALKNATGAQLSMVVIGSLQREPVDAVAHAIFQGWAGASATPDDRALLLISVGDRRDTLVAGSQLQSVLDANAIDQVLSETHLALSQKLYGQALMAAADEIGGRIAAARHKMIPVRLPKRAHRQWSDSFPWPLAAGSIVIIGLLAWLLRRPHHRLPAGDRA
ncbi:MAG TPA: TPM domain-containing protein [Bryobacteraceae bacterium]|jgi:uncharacterized membrane protein YgcG|nr:TPM domain-containing protein [Bryobacteraceae bacterium]